MQYLHTMLRVTDLNASMDFFCAKLGLIEVSRRDFPGGRFTLVFLAAPADAEAA
ncbi:MAG: VOC family protein, partial [Gammaproteobacteria bacterium]